MSEIAIGNICTAYIGNTTAGVALSSDSAVRKVFYPPPTIGVLISNGSISTMWVATTTHAAVITDDNAIRKTQNDALGKLNSYSYWS